jgi:hypothetical protein
MNINEIILNERLGASGAKDQPSVFQDIGDFAGRVGSDIVDTGKMVGNAAVSAGKASIDPETYKQAGRDIEQGWEFAKKNPKQAALNVAHTADDAIRAGSNALTFGGADWVASKLAGTDLQTQKDLSQAAWERSPKASMAGAIAGSLADPGFYAGAKLAGKGLAKVLPAATTKTGKVATGATKFGGQTVGGFTGSRAGWDASDKLQGEPVKESDELSDIKRLSGQSISEAGAPHFRAPHVSAPHGSGIAGLDPNVKAAQGRNPDISYQERVRAAQQQKDAAKASGPVDPKQIDNPQQAAQQKQIQALSDKIAGDEKKAADAKTRSRATKVAAATALVGGGLYLKDKLTPDSKWANTDDYDKFIAKYHADQDANKDTNKEQTPAINTTSTPQSTDTDNGSMFSKETFKTNESVSELDRVIHLMNYRK